jgi:hypothetical protein
VAVVGGGRGRCEGDGRFAVFQKVADRQPPFTLLKHRLPIGNFLKIPKNT